MKNSMLRFFGIFVFIICASCDPNDGDGHTISDDDFAHNFGAPVSRDFIGQITDPDHQPLVGATVTVNGSSVQTDANGVFIVNGAAVYEKFAYIRVVKSGYMDGSRAMVPASGKNMVKIILIPATPVATVHSGVPSTVMLPDNSKIFFDGAFEDENGQSYAGNVSVSAVHLAPSYPDAGDMMPGMPMAKGEDGKVKFTESAGMLAVELYGDSGQTLELPGGTTRR